MITWCGKVANARTQVVFPSVKAIPPLEDLHLNQALDCTCWLMAALSSPVEENAMLCSAQSVF